MSDLVRVRLMSRAESLASVDIPSDLADWLEARDGPLFDPAWVEAHKLVEGVETDWTAELARVAFLSIYDSVAAEPDVAAYVSDDLRLIGQYIEAGQSSDWIAGLLAVYQQNQLPTGIVPPRSTTIVELLTGTSC